MRDLAFITISTCNYLHSVSCLAESLMQHHPEAPLYVGLVDAPGEIKLPEHENIRYFQAKDLNITNWKRYSFQYWNFPLCASLKAPAIEMVLDLQYEKVIFIDADTYVYRPMTEVLDRLDTHDIIITPHLSDPANGDEGPDVEISLRTTAGTFNSGFLALRNNANGRSMVAWWKHRKTKHCLHNTPHTFVDQTWFDFVPNYFENLWVERHKGYNVGHWSLPERPITLSESGELLADGQPLVFYHFSGFEPENPYSISKYMLSERRGWWNRYDVQPALVVLAEGYREALARANPDYYRSFPYGHATLSDGTPISNEWREAVRLEHPLLAGIEDPYDTSATPELVSLLNQASAQVQTKRPTWGRRIKSIYNSVTRRVSLKQLAAKPKPQPSAAPSQKVEPVAAVSPQPGPTPKRRVPAFKAPKMVSSAMNREDVLLFRAFPKSQGFYIDVGAAHPSVDSSTKWMYDIGWQGINLEPYAESAERFRQERPRDVNIHCLVTDQVGEISYDSGNGSESGAKIQATTLTKVCEAHVAGEVDFLRIDANGNERAVLLGMDFDRYRPRVLVIEHTHSESWNHLVLEARYHLVQFDGIYRFYVREEDLHDLAPRLAAPVNCMDEFTTSCEPIPNEHTQLARLSQLETLLDSLKNKPVIGQVLQLSSKKFRRATRQAA
ncbi:FkbM family methyltransferase [Bremerella cremea]|uniref:FkbM family methyltransferase n=1 Tax=Bremerella cremea TaxID=1031537 RepID=UPI0031EF3C2E